MHNQATDYRQHLRSKFTALPDGIVCRTYCKSCDKLIDEVHSWWGFPEPPVASFLLHLLAAHPKLAKRYYIEPGQATRLLLA